eukprot:12243834-Heterocapsa_arctica.AAC.1
MAGQNYAKAHQKPQPQGAGGPWGGAGGGAVVVFAMFSHRFGRSCARNPLWRVIAPLIWHAAI